MCITSNIADKFDAYITRKENTYLHPFVRNEPPFLISYYRRVNIACLHLIEIPLHTICSVADAAFGTLSGTITLFTAFGGIFSSKIEASLYTPCRKFTIQQFSTHLLAHELAKIFRIINPGICIIYTISADLQNIGNSATTATEIVQSHFNYLSLCEHRKIRDAILPEKIMHSLIQRLAHIVALVTMAVTVPLDLITGTFNIVSQLIVEICLKFIPLNNPLDNPKSIRGGSQIILALQSLDLTHIIGYAFKNIFAIILPPKKFSSEPELIQSGILHSII